MGCCCCWSFIPRTLTGAKRIVASPSVSGELKRQRKVGFLDAAEADPADPCCLPSPEAQEKGPDEAPAIVDDGSPVRSTHHSPNIGTVA